MGVRDHVHEDVSSGALLGTAGEVEALSRGVAKRPTVLPMERPREMQRVWDIAVCEIGLQIRVGGETGFVCFV